MSYFMRNIVLPEKVDLSSGVVANFSVPVSYRSFDFFGQLSKVEQVGGRQVLAHVVEPIWKKNTMK